MLYGQLPEFPYGDQTPWQALTVAGVPWIEEQPMAADQWDWEWYDDWDNDNPGRGFRPIRRRRLRPRRVGIPFGKISFGKIPFGRAPYGQVPFGKLFGKF